MATRKFAGCAGGLFFAGPASGTDPRGRFKIVRLLPETGNAFQYRVKSQTDGHERVVREDQLARS